jgi:hypothetical protein
MIDIEQRSMLTDALTPPPGYTFASGLATTFSLDLVTLLTLPLHLAWLSDGQEDGQQIDPLRIIEALRRTAGKLTVICQRGRMQVPRSASPLMMMLEGMVHEVLALHGGAFHPKVWVLRFTSDDHPGETRMRLLVLSRNITDDGSWDLSLQLDGTCGRGQIKQNAPLRDFMTKSLQLYRNPISDVRQRDLEETTAAVMRCEWELPSGFDEVNFHVLGLGKKPVSWLPGAKGTWDEQGTWDELGVISPFVKANALISLAKTSTKPLFLIARSVELDQLPDPIPDKFEKVLTLDERIEMSDEEDDRPNRERGLHAKVFVGRRGWNTHLFIGSANATDAALINGVNVEFMAELIGKHSKVGKPEIWLGAEGMQNLLFPYQRSVPELAEDVKANKKVLDDLRNAIVAENLQLDCSSAEGGWAIYLHGLHRITLGRAEVAVWPLSFDVERAVIYSGNAEDKLLLGVFAKNYITSLTGFRLTVGKEELQFGLNLPMSNAPEGRELEILRAAMLNREGFVRYLLLLLGDLESQPTGPGSNGGKNSSPHWPGGASDGAPIFEMLARAFVGDQARLRHISQVIKKLQQESDSGVEDLIPTEFMTVWKCFEEAMIKKARQ